MNRVFIKTYGCQMNERDSDAVAAMLRARGYRIVDKEEICDILLLNTCSVRDSAEQKAIGKAANVVARESDAIPTSCSGSSAAWRRTVGPRSSILCPMST